MTPASRVCVRLFVQSQDYFTHMDNPKVRAGNVCPLCRGEKALGLVVCWGCYRKYGMRDGNEEAERMIARTETELHADGPAMRLLFSFSSPTG